jgi:NADH dehydrogenase/NADH:ubiquinone oxidoreductase subunit G
MQRRKVDPPVDGEDKGDGSPLGMSSKRVGRRGAPPSRKGRGISGIFVIVVLIAALIMIGAATFLSPQVQDAEINTARKTKDLVHDVIKIEQEMEKQVGDLFHQKVEEPLVKKNVAEATAAMEQQPSSWVNGEKKLKEKLKILHAKQRKGEELGVPVLTRYLGEDIPAWAGEGVNAEEWRKQVDAKYKEMAEQEKQWRNTMKAMDERYKKETAR